VFGRRATVKKGRGAVDLSGNSNKPKAAKRCVLNTLSIAIRTYASVQLRVPTQTGPALCYLHRLWVTLSSIQGPFRLT
jgi:hypothetical protein